MTDAPKLKPCPFCGNADELLYGFGGRIFCDECGCEGPFSHFFKGDWNTRADLIDMDVLRRVEAAWPAVRQIILEYSLSFPYAEQNGDDEVVNEMNAAITALHAMMEKLK